jgi:TolA-binding protein
MRNTLQEQYNSIKEGKGAKDVFLKHAKSLFPNLIPNHYEFNSASKILLQRGIISENMILNENLWGVTTGNNKQPDWFKLFEDYTASSEEKETKADASKPSKEVDEYKEKSASKQYEAKTGDDVIFDQYLNGIQIEACKSENNGKTVDELKKIVLKNLKKDNLYYTKNAAFGVEGIGYTEDAPGLGATKEVKGKYASSGMEPVKLKEDLSNPMKSKKLYYHVLEDGGYGRIGHQGYYNTEAEAKKRAADLQDMFPKSFFYVEAYPSKKEPVTVTMESSKMNESLESLSDSELMDLANDEGMEELIVKNPEGGIENREALIAALSQSDESKVKEAAMYGDSDGDRDADMESSVQANEYYEKGLQAYSEGDLLKAEQYYNAALKAGSWLGWTEFDLPPYETMIKGNMNIKESQLRSVIRQLIKEELNLKEIDQIGEEAAKGAKVKKINDEINKRKKKIKALETLKELEDDSINPKKLKELYSEIKKLEAAKNKLEKKDKKKETLVDEVTVVDKTTTSDEVADIVKQEKTTPAAVKQAISTAKTSGKPVNVA